MEPTKPHFPRSVSSTTVHSLPAVKGAPSAGFDSQVMGTPSMAIKPPKMGKMSGLPKGGV